MISYERDNNGHIVRAVFTQDVKRDAPGFFKTVTKTDAPVPAPAPAKIPTRQKIVYKDGLPTVVEVVDFSAIASATIAGCKTTTGKPSQQVVHHGQP